MALTRKFLVAATALAALGAFAVPGQAQTHAPQFAPGYVQAQHYGPPPPPRHEARPGPRHGHQWVPGHWEPRGPRHVWINGHWVPQRPGYAYAQPAWRERDGRWDMDRGRWERRRDADRDGVPNRHDRRPNDPYRY